MPLGTTKSVFCEHAIVKQQRVYWNLVILGHPEDSQLRRLSIEWTALMMPITKGLKAIYNDCQCLLTSSSFLNLLIFKRQ